MSVGGVRRIEVAERESPVFGGTEIRHRRPYERLQARYSASLIRRIP